MYNKETFFKLIESLGFNNKTISEGTGISTGNISDWKKGKSKPKIEAIEKIADFLNCSVDYLLGRTDNPEINRSAPEEEYTVSIAAFGGASQKSKLTKENLRTLQDAFEEFPD